MYSYESSHRPVPLYLGVIKLFSLNTHHSDESIILNIWAFQAQTPLSKPEEITTLFQPKSHQKIVKQNRFIKM